MSFLSSFFNKSTVWLLVLLIFIIFGIGCNDTPHENVEQCDKIVIAIDPTFVPMAFINDQKQLDGFEVDLIKKIASTAGCDYEFVNVDWPGLFGGLITKKFNLIMSSITILDERKERMAFSHPYLRSGVALLVRKDLKNVNSIDDLNDNDGIVGAQLNTTSYYFIEKRPKLNIKGYEKFGHALIDLINGGAIAIVGDITQVNYFYKSNKDVFNKTKIVGKRLMSEEYGIVFNKDDLKLKNKINNALAELIKNGTVQKIRDKWELGEFAEIPSVRMDGQ
jgi:polar amino acid transport system substrate-binding protein